MGRGEDDSGAARVVQRGWLAWRTRVSSLRTWAGGGLARQAEDLRSSVLFNWGERKGGDTAWLTGSW